MTNLIYINIIIIKVCEQIIFYQRDVFNYHYNIIIIHCIQPNNNTGLHLQLFNYA